MLGLVAGAFGLFVAARGSYAAVQSITMLSPAATGRAPLFEHWVRTILTERDADKAATHARRYIKDVHQRVLQAVVRWPSVMTSEVSPLPRR